MTNPATMGATVAVLLAVAAAPAGAYEELHAPDAIRVCLCLDRAVTARSDELNQANETYDGERKALAELESRATTARQQIDPADKAQREALGRLLNQRDAAVQSFAAEATPHYNAIVGRYNDAAEAFNHACGDKTYDWSVLQQVQDGLTCPPSPEHP